MASDPPSPAGGAKRRRGVPRGRSGQGLTIRDLVARTGKSRATVSRHLKRLSEYGLAFSQNQQDGSTRWWRYRVNPDLVAERHGIPNTAQLKAAKHQAQRRHYWQGITSARDDGRVVRVRIDGQDHYIDTGTGAVLWVDPSPPA